MARRERPSRLPRGISSQTRRARGAGAELTCLLLGRRPGEWIALDVASGSFVRFDHPGEQAPKGAWPGRSLLGLRLDADDEVLDPARPEAVCLLEPPTLLPAPRRRAVRRLLDAVTQPDRQGAMLLDTRGPSVAYVDLDGHRPSLALIRADRQLELVSKGNAEATLALRFGDLDQQLPMLDPPAQRAAQSAAPKSLSGDALDAVLGFRPGYVLVGLDRIENGHARKVGLALLER